MFKQTVPLNTNGVFKLILPGTTNQRSQTLKTSRARNLRLLVAETRNSLPSLPLQITKAH